MGFLTADDLETMTLQELLLWCIPNVLGKAYNYVREGKKLTPDTVFVEDDYYQYEEEQIRHQLKQGSTPLEDLVTEEVEKARQQVEETNVQIERNNTHIDSLLKQLDLWNYSPQYQDLVNAVRRELTSSRRYPLIFNEESERAYYRSIFSTDVVLEDLAMNAQHQKEEQELTAAANEWFSQLWKELPDGVR